MMSSLPLLHFRRLAHECDRDPELRNIFFAGTGLDIAAIRADDFALEFAVLAQVMENLRGACGTYWSLRFPMLWGLDMHAHSETAMRFAPTLRHGVDVLLRFGHRRWRFAEWSKVVDGDQLRMAFRKTLPLADPHWHNFSLIALKNVQTIMGAAFPGENLGLHFLLPGPPPDGMDAGFGTAVTWNADHCGFLVPEAVLDTPSVLADAHAYQRLVDVLIDSSDSASAAVTVRVEGVLKANPVVQMAVEQVAAELGVSARTLTRQLAAESTSFRAIQSDVLKRRLKVLLADRSLSLAGVAQKLGYADETALSRAARRWYGQSLAQVRKAQNGSGGASLMKG